MHLVQASRRGAMGAWERFCLFLIVFACGFVCLLTLLTQNYVFDRHASLFVPRPVSVSARQSRVQHPNKRIKINPTE